MTSFTRKLMGGNLLSLQRPQPTLLPSPLTPRTLFLAWWRSCKTKRGEKVKVEARHHLRGSVKVWRKNNMKGSSYGEFSPICLFCTHNTSSWCENITWIKRKEERCFLIHVQTLSHSCDALWFIYLTYPYIR